MPTYFSKFIKEGSFIKDVMVTVSWNGAIVLVQVFLSPIVTRLYGPAEYGVFALFNSIVVNLALVGSIKYAEAIVLADDEKEKNNLVAIALLLNATITALAFIILAFFRTKVASFIGLKGSPAVLFLIPVSFSITCLIEVMVNVNIRRRLFNRNGFASFSSNLISRLNNIFYASMASAKATGLIVGDLIGKATCVVTLMVTGRDGSHERGFFRTISKAGIKAAGYKFRSFPLYFFPSHAVNLVSSHLPLYCFQWLYGSVVVGAYALASSMLEIINRLIPYSLAPVLLKKAYDLKNISHELLCDRVYKLFLVMLAVATVIFATVCLLGRIVFPFVFGDSWKTAGVYSGIIAIPLAFNFVAVALSEVYNVVQRQRFLLANTLVNFFLKVSAILILVAWGANDENALLIFSIFNSIGSLFLVLGVFVILRYRVWQAFGLLLISFVILFVSYVAGKYLMNF